MVSNRVMVAKAQTFESARARLIQRYTVAPVEHRADACRKATDTGLPMTVYATNDIDMLYHVSNSFWHETRRNLPSGAVLAVAPLVTMLPIDYFYQAGQRIAGIIVERMSCSHGAVNQYCPHCDGWPTATR